MHRLTVLYGHPTDPSEFDRYYHEVHIPIARKMKGLKGWTIGKCTPADPGAEAPYYMIVGLYADSPEQMQAILTSPEGQATIADAIMDRLIHNSHRLALDGESLRKKRAHLTDTDGTE